MNKKSIYKIFAILFLLSLGLSSCKDDDPKPTDTPKTKGILTLQFSHTVDGIALTKILQPILPMRQVMNSMYPHFVIIFQMLSLQNWMVRKFFILFIN